MDYFATPTLIKIAPGEGFRFWPEDLGRMICQGRGPFDLGMQVISHGFVALRARWRTDGCIVRIAYSASFIWPLAIMCISSMPLNRMRAQRKILEAHFWSAAGPATARCGSALVPQIGAAGRGPAAVLRHAIANYRKAKKLMRAWEDETEDTSLCITYAMFRNDVSSLTELRPVQQRNKAGKYGNCPAIPGLSQGLHPDHLPAAILVLSRTQSGRVSVGMAQTSRDCELLPRQPRRVDRRPQQAEKRAADPLRKQILFEGGLGHSLRYFGSWDSKAELADLTVIL